MAKVKYTYLYKGAVCRNSNHVYNFGLVNHNDVIIACSSTEKGALKNKTYWINLHKSNLEYYLKHGKTNLAEGTKKDLENTEKWHVVPLERIEN